MIGSIVYLEGKVDEINILSNRLETTSGGIAKAIKQPGETVVRVEFSDIFQANLNIRERIVVTPLLNSPGLSDLVGATISLKCENLQETGSFKARGAYNLVTSLGSGEFITASSGNFGKAVAKAIAEKPGSSLLTVVPEMTPIAKIEAIQHYGSEVVLHGAEYGESETYAYHLASLTGRSFLHSEAKEVIAGQGTLALEVLLEKVDFDVIVVPAASGGLLYSTAIVAKALNPRIKVIGVQSEASPPWYYSFKAKKLVPVKYEESIADGLLGGISQQMLDLALEVVDDFVLVTEDSIAQAMYLFAKEHGMISEGSGAVTIAALISQKIPNIKGKKVLAIVSGGNMDLAKFATIIQRFA